ncbi:tryptophan synthase, alpha chain [Anoxybacillus pushchinoensis]|jgi:tryptophan synthase alpha chain|uniref:Tryptophan synthase alpha chain n=1 Tax=Anoxybacillus pushchinoensis TaxID=150248 RepID=A0A1I0SMZ3_9BACL|nr:tryptophan synthase subunit alpha [Anoxybacillus pushchinoensis]SFA40880.1 tryptophan synthase, alpha chain [Anoxybacillus pushchinoensis]
MKHFIPFIVAGDPSEEVTIDLAIALEQAGATILELGVPYSDPLADGPIIQRAASRALKQGMTLTTALELIGRMRKKGVKIPIIVFTYYNPVLQLGEERFFALAQQNGANGVLIPDLPFEESEHMRMLGDAYDIPYISLVAPTSHERIAMIASQAKSFLYCVSSLGVTGIRDSLPTQLHEFLQQVKRYSRVPVVVGFGISNAQQVEQLQHVCDGIVIGSAIVQKIEQLQDELINIDTRQRALTAFSQYVAALIEPLKKVENNESETTITTTKTVPTGQTD